MQNYFKENKKINLTALLEVWRFYESQVKPADTNVGLLEPFLKASKIFENREPKKMEKVSQETPQGEDEEEIETVTVEEIQDRLEELKTFARDCKELDPFFATELNTKRGILNLLFEKIKNNNDRVIEIFFEILENCENSMLQFKSNHEFVSYISIQPMNEEIFLILYNNAGEYLERDQEIKRAQFRLTYIFLMCSSWSLEIMSEIKKSDMENILNHFKHKELTLFQKNVLENLKVESFIYFRDGRSQLIKSFKKPQEKNNYERVLLKDINYTLRTENIEGKYNLRSFFLNNQFDFLLNHKFLNQVSLG